LPRFPEIPGDYFFKWADNIFSIYTNPCIADRTEIQKAPKQQGLAEKQKIYWRPGRADGRQN